MFCHWEYVLSNLFGRIEAVSAVGAVHLPSRVDEAGAAYATTAEDAAYAHFRIEGGIVVSLNSSWCVRVRRDELFELQVDGTDGSAVAGLRGCVVQPGVATPRSVWNPDLPDPVAHRAAWQDVPDTEPLENGFKVQWERFLRHVADDEPFPWDFFAGARGIRLAELGLQSWREGRWVEVPA
jgi:predicted dehydrogenase